jgi:hypothetical protein
MISDSGHGCFHLLIPSKRWANNYLNQKWFTIFTGSLHPFNNFMTERFGMSFCCIHVRKILITCKTMVCYLHCMITNLCLAWIKNLLQLVLRFHVVLLTILFLCFSYSHIIVPEPGKTGRKRSVIIRWVSCDSQLQNWNDEINKINHTLNTTIYIICIQTPIILKHAGKSTILVPIRCSCWGSCGFIYLSYLC